MKSNRNLDAWVGRRGSEPQAGRRAAGSGGLLADGRPRARLAFVRMQPLDPACSLMAASD